MIQTVWSQILSEFVGAIEGDSEYMSDGFVWEQNGVGGGYLSSITYEPIPGVCLCFIPSALFGILTTGGHEQSDL